MKAKHRKTIAVVGGGISGSLTAFHLSRKTTAARVIVIDPAERPGLGLAYSTPSMKHLLNVPAKNMTLLPGEPDHFLRWLRENHDRAAAGDQFMPRAVFGRYMQSLLQTAPGLEHIRGLVTDYRLENDGASLFLADGRKICADWVVLAVGNFLPARLGGVSEAAEIQRVYCHSAWERQTYEGVHPDSTILLIGSGLTAVDVWIRLRELGHRGRIRMISRHGRLPAAHAPYRPLPDCVIDEPPTRARDLLRAVRRAIRSGQSWRAVADSFRERTNEFWMALPYSEQRRFKRHLQRRWDIVRHRMAPAVAKELAHELEVHSVEVLQGRVLSVEAFGGGAQVYVKSRDGDTQSWEAARVINCTGPDLNYSRVGSSLLTHLLERGDAVAGPLGVGLWSDGRGALRSRSGKYSNVLFNVGPGRQGVLLESIAVPELRQQAADLAEVLVREIVQSSYADVAAGD